MESESFHIRGGAKPKVLSRCGNSKKSNQHLQIALVIHTWPVLLQADESGHNVRRLPLLLALALPCCYCRLLRRPPGISLAHPPAVPDHSQPEHIALVEVP